MSNVNNLKDRLDKQVKLLLKAVAKEEDFQNYKIEEAPGAGKGDGYLGYITAADVTGKTVSGEEKTLHLIVKSASKSNAVRNETPLSNVFDREIYMYNTLIPAFRRFEKERNVSPFSSSAKCYKACMLEKSEALILENLKEAGYSVWDRRIPMDNEHVSLVIKEYGRLHSISFAMRDQEPEIFKRLTENLYDIFTMFIEKTNFIKTFERHSRRALDTLDPVADRKAHTVFKTFIEQELLGFMTNVPKIVDNYSVVLHGDGWTNNMMFKYDDTSNTKKPNKMCLIDLQLSRLGSPVLDISYFLYSCGSKEVLNNHERYLDMYHDSLSAHLEKLGSDSKKLYPRSVFRQQWKKLSRFGLVCATLLIYAMLSEQDEVIDFTEIAESGMSVADAFDYEIANLKDYNERLRHIILLLVNNGYM